MMQIDVALKILPASKACESNTGRRVSAPTALAGVQSSDAESDEPHENDHLQGDRGEVGARRHGDTETS